MTWAHHRPSLPHMTHQGISGCKRQAVVQMRCCAVDLPCGDAGTDLPVHARLLDSMAQATDRFTKGAGKAQGLSYASTLGQSKREKCVNNFNLMGHQPF